MSLDDASDRVDPTAVYEAYRRYVNPTLARVMRLSGSPTAVRAEGCTVWDAQGKAYLDFAGGYGVFTLGHRHPRVLAAVRDQLERMPLSAKTMFNPVLARLAERLAELTPGDLALSFLTNSGTEAVEAALKLARAATGRTRFVATDQAYHGKTFGALSVSGRDAFRRPFEPLLADVLRVPFGDLAALEAALPGAAAFIVEPIQAEGGVNLPPAGYLAAAHVHCRSAGVLLILDEVQTGLGRCGARFAADTEGVVPDVMTLAKGLSGGVIPIGAMITTARLWEAAYRQDPLLHTSTFGGNELACAAALAALDVLEEEGLAERAAMRGAQLLAGARAIADEYPGVIETVRGRGLLVGVVLRHEGYGGAILPEMLHHGVTAAWTLNQQRVIRLEPPLIVDAAQIAEALAALRAGVARAWRELGALTNLGGCEE